MVLLTIAASSTPPAPGHPSWKFYALLAGVFIALTIAGLALGGGLRREDPRTRLEDQLDRHYAPRHGAGQTGGEEASREGRVAGVAVGYAARILGASRTRRLAWRLDLAGIGCTPAEWVVLGVCAGLVVVVVLTVLTGIPLLGVLVGAVVEGVGMRLIVSLRIARRRSAFAEQLPDVLQLIAGSLQSGFSLPQALDAVVRDDTQPAAEEFARALAETRLGGELEAALDRIADRMASIDLRWTVMAIRIQRSVGGNLVEVLRNTVGMMRERAQLRRHVRALSAEGRLSAYILVALPVLVGAWLFLSRREYMRPLYTTPFGLVMLIGAVVLVVLGTVWMRAVIKVEA